MRRSQAKKIAEGGITWRTYQDVLEKAMASCEDWKSASTINPSLSRGTAFNIFLGPLKDRTGDRLDEQVSYLIAKNMLTEFGGYTYDDEPPAKRDSGDAVEVHHQDPEDWPF